MDFPIIVFFRIKKIERDFVTLEWDTENAHSVEIQGVGSMAFDAECRLKRDSERRQEYILIAKNLESKLESKATLEVFPAPVIEKFECEVLKGNKIHLKSEVKNAAKVWYEGLDMPFQNSVVFNKKQLENGKILLCAKGKNEIETVVKSVEIIQESIFIQYKSIFLGVAGTMLMLCLLLFIFTRTDDKEALMSSKSIDNSSEYILLCDTTGDPISVVKQKLKSILAQLPLISLKNRIAEGECIERLLPSSDLTLIVQTAEGQDYHKLLSYLKKEEPLALALDSFNVSTKGKAVSKVKIYASVTDVPQKTMPTASAMPENVEEPRKTIANTTIPPLFQGKVKGRTRRLQVRNQARNGTLVEFQYSVIGSSSEQNKTGKLNIETGELELETMGKGLSLLIDGRMVWQIKDADANFDSIN